MFSYLLTLCHFVYIPPPSPASVHWYSTLASDVSTPSLLYKNLWWVSWYETVLFSNVTLLSTQANHSSLICHLSDCPLWFLVVSTCSSFFSQAYIWSVFPLSCAGVCCPAVHSSMALLKQQLWLHSGVFWCLFCLKIQFCLHPNLV